jgi:hypothetical protein
MPNGMSWPTPEHQQPARRRVLLVGFEPSTQDSISAVLNTMGWTSMVIRDLEEVKPRFQHASFEAVLVSLRHSAEELERMILAIKEIRPTLSERVVVVSSGAVGSEILELIERYDLSHLPQEKVLSRLWSTLEDLVAFPPWYRVAARNIGVARLLFDSLRMHGLIGVRSSRKSGRRFIYEHNNTTIDVQLDIQPGSNRISLMGQVLDGTRPPSSYENLAVILNARNGTLARTTTNRQGEFILQFEFAENVSLEIRVGERSWISVPLTQLEWAKEKLRKRTGT